MPDSAISPDEMVSHDSSSSIEAFKNWEKMLLNTPGSFDTVQLLKKKNLWICKIAFFDMYLLVGMEFLMLSCFIHPLSCGRREFMSRHTTLIMILVSGSEPFVGTAVGMLLLMLPPN